MLEQHPLHEEKPQHIGVEGESLPLEALEVPRYLRAREIDILRVAGNVLDAADGEKLETHFFRKLAAVLVFCAATGTAVEASASGEGESLEPLPDYQKNVTYSLNAKSPQNFRGIQIPFDWESVARKVGDAKEPVSRNDFEVVSIKTPSLDGTYSVMDSYMPIQSSLFYQGVSEDEHRNTLLSLWSTVEISGDYASFIESLKSINLSDAQKLIALQNIGGYSSATYNYDMLANNESVVVSDDKMFQGVKSFVEKKKTTEIVPTGICGNIHTFLVKTAKSFGFDAWFQSGMWRKKDSVASGHVWAGLVAKDTSGKEQIVFLNYDKIIPTGTMNYQDALGVAERYFRQISVFTSYVGGAEGGLVPVRSAAQQSIESASGFEGSESILDKRFRYGEDKEIPRPEGLGVLVSNTKTEVSFTKDMLAFVFTREEDKQNNPYKSLASMDAFRATFRAEGKHAGVNAEVTLLNLSLKDLGDGVLAQREIISHLGLDFINSHHFTKGEYEQFVVRYGLSIEAGMRQILGEKTQEDFGGLSGGMLEGTVGAKILYTDPANAGTVYLGASDTWRAGLSDLEDQKVVVPESSRKLEIGGSLNVYQGVVLNIDASAANVGHGQKYGIQAKFTAPRVVVEVGAEKVVSEVEHIIPSSEKITAGVSYRFSGVPLAEVGVFGSVKNDHYKGADDKDYQVGIKARIILW